MKAGISKGANSRRSHDKLGFIYAAIDPYLPLDLLDSTILWIGLLSSRS